MTDERFPDLPRSLQVNRWQFDKGLKSQSHSDLTTLSPESVALVFGDKSLDGHVERLLRGCHAAAVDAYPVDAADVVEQVKAVKRG